MYLEVFTGLFTLTNLLCSQIDVTIDLKDVKRIFSKRTSVKKMFFN